MNFCDEEIEVDDRIVADEGERELYEHFRFVADKGQSLLRVDKFLVTRLENASRNRIQQAAEAGCILVNGKAVKSNYRVKPLDIVSIVMDRPRYEFEIIPQDIPLDTPGTRELQRHAGKRFGLLFQEYARLRCKRSPAGIGTPYRQRHVGAVGDCKNARSQDQFRHTVLQQNHPSKICSFGMGANGRRRRYNNREYRAQLER